MMYAWAYLSRFEINVFDYAQIGDFLLVSLKVPFTWFIVLLSLLAVTSDNWMSRRWGSRERVRWLRWYGTPGYRRMNDLILVLLVLFLIYVHASVRAERAFHGEGNTVEVRLADDSAPFEAIQLGSTSLFLFFYDAGSRRVSAYPHESVHSVSRQLSEGA